MSGKHVEISEETKLPLKMVIAIVIGACALVGWASRVESGITAWAKTRRDVDGVQGSLLRLRMDMHLVKEKLGIPPDAKPVNELKDDD